MFWIKNGKDRIKPLQRVFGGGTKIRIMVLLLGFSLLQGCAHLRTETTEIDEPEQTTPTLYRELVNVTETEQKGKEEFVVRFSSLALFDTGEYYLRPGVERMLTDVADVLKKYPAFIIIVEGHTDSQGRESYNQWLSERRSRFVADFLVKEGVDPYRIQVVGYGESRPLVVEHTANDRQQNRRVELYLKLDEEQVN